MPCWPAVSACYYDEDIYMYVYHLHASLLHVEISIDVCTLLVQQMHTSVDIATTNDDRAML